MSTRIVASATFAVGVLVYGANLFLFENSKKGSAFALSTMVLSVMGGALFSYASYLEKTNLNLITLRNTQLNKNIPRTKETARKAQTSKKVIFIL